MNNSKNTYADQLERKIKGLMKQIKDNTTAPSKTNIGTLFAELKKVDEAAHATLIAEYTPICAQWKQKQLDILNSNNAELKK